MRRRDHDRRDTGLEYSDEDMRWKTLINEWLSKVSYSILVIRWFWWRKVNIQHIQTIKYDLSLESINTIFLRNFIKHQSFAGLSRAVRTKSCYQTFFTTTSTFAFILFSKNFSAEPNGQLLRFLDFYLHL